MIVAASLNAMIAAAVWWLAYRLWRWRNYLISLNQALRQTSISPQAAGYGLMLKRAQIAQTRLTLAQIQTRSQQMIQTLRTIRMLQSVLRYRRH
ncbi:MAG: hypothetical protein DCF25_04995 [Leptolyngbya foveolarum]|uniref:Uncharacterized protein n=1 Tax=Leptolyngbya foveolarum TaxID=47253 RepID=A0A2W4ULH7_9CYAN|nr:MAG: hypothetical protein DCF25_04995 [Leptolyngbya foveolarum]